MRGLESVAGFQVGGFGPAVGGVVPEAVMCCCRELLVAGFGGEGDLDEVTVGGGADDAVDPVLLRAVRIRLGGGDMVADVELGDRFRVAVGEKDSRVPRETVASLRPTASAARISRLRSLRRLRCCFFRFFGGGFLGALGDFATALAALVIRFQFVEPGLMSQRVPISAGSGKRQLYSIMSSTAWRSHA